MLNKLNSFNFFNYSFNTHIKDLFASKEDVTETLNNITNKISILNNEVEELLVEIKEKNIKHYDLTYNLKLKIMKNKLSSLCNSFYSSINHSMAYIQVYENYQENQKDKKNTEQLIQDAAFHYKRYKIQDLISIRKAQKINFENIELKIVLNFYYIAEDKINKT